jgi:hypothetical protein
VKPDERLELVRDVFPGERDNVGESVDVSEFDQSEHSWQPIDLVRNASESSAPPPSIGLDRATGSSPRSD